MADSAVTGEGKFFHSRAPGGPADRPTSASDRPGRGPRSAAHRRAHGILRQLLDGRGWTVLRVTSDLLLLYLAVVAALLGAPAAGIGAADGFGTWMLPLVVVGLLAVRGSYATKLEVDVLSWVASALGAMSLAAMSLIAIDSLVVSDGGSSGLVVRTWLFGVLYLAGGRVVLGLVQRGARAERVIGKPTLIVGAGRIGAQLERRLETHPELGLIPVGYLDADPIPDELAPRRHAPVLGPPSQFSRIVRETGVQHVIFAFQSEPDHVLLPLVRKCEEQGLEMSLVPRLFDSINARVELEHMGGLPLYGLRTVSPRGWQFTVKHALGRSMAMLLLILLSPVMLTVALVVKLTSPGPVILRQRRIGRDGHEFDFLKFRSLMADRGASGRTAARANGGGSSSGPDSQVGAAEGDLRPGWAELGLRPTPVGAFLRRTSLDELPQLWNVTKGDMTLVGPRPEEPQFVEVFGQSVRRYDERHRVKSGVTGWAQVNGLRGASTSIADRVEWDNYYIENWSLWLDFKILVMTLAAPFRSAE